MRVTSVSRCLDKRLMMFGFEIPDLLVIFLTLSILNFIFSQSNFKIVLVWIPTLILTGILKYGKRGKPEKYLIHFIRFHLNPGIFSAFQNPTKSELLKNY